MKSADSMPNTQDWAAGISVQSVYREDARYAIRGDVFFRMHDGESGEIQLERQHRNLVVRDASILLARLMKDNLEPAHGVFALAVGTGDSGWDLQSPPTPTTSLRSLATELTRKTFAETKFIDGAGLPTVIPTNVVDFTTTFAEAEAVGPLVEMALLGGDISSVMSERKPVPGTSYDPTVDLTQYDTMINVLRFPVINKPPTSTLSITWRLTF